MAFDSKIPGGEMNEKWNDYKGHVKLVNPANKRRAIWYGIVNGLLEGASADFGSRINKGIDQAFRQSPYLSH